MSDDQYRIGEAVSAEALRANPEREAWRVPVMPPGPRPISSDPSPNLRTFPVMLFVRDIRIELDGARKVYFIRRT